MVRHFWTAVPLLFVTGFFGIMVMASCNARLQAETPSELRGRIIGIYVLLSGGVFPIGGFLVGPSPSGREYPRRSCATARVDSPRSGSSPSPGGDAGADSTPDPSPVGFTSPGQAKFCH
jgi:hypothetical protein